MRVLVIRFSVAVRGAPPRHWQRLAELEQVVLAVLRATGARTPIVDELHNGFAGRSGVRREFLNLIRCLGSQLRTPLVGVGSREGCLAIAVYLLARSDGTLDRSNLL